MLKFEAIEEHIMQQNEKLIAESQSKRKRINDQLSLIQSKTRNITNEMKEFSKNLKNKIQEVIDQKTIEKATRSDILKQTEAKEVVEGTTSWFTRKAVDLTGYGETIQNYVSKWYQGDVEKKIKDIAALKIRINELDKEIANQQQKLKNIKVEGTYKHDFDMFKADIQALRDQEKNVIGVIGNIQNDLIGKYSPAAKQLTSQRTELFKKSKCSGTTPTQIRECKQYLVKQIKSKQPKLQTCQALPDSFPTFITREEKVRYIGQILNKIEHCRRAYQDSKK